MTRQELRVELAKWFCGCDMPEAAAAFLRDVLRRLPAFEHKGELEALVPGDGPRVLLLYTLAHFELTEHGGSVGGSWLSEKGKALLAALDVEVDDGFATLMVDACVHGYGLEGESCPECRKLSPMFTSCEG